MLWAQFGYRSFVVKSYPEYDLGGGHVWTVTPADLGGHLNFKKNLKLLQLFSIFFWKFERLVIRTRLNGMFINFQNNSVTYYYSLSIYFFKLILNIYNLHFKFESFTCNITLFFLNGDHLVMRRFGILKISQEWTLK